MKRPLLLTVVATLAITALVPLAIGFLQLRSNTDALLEQVQRTHMVASSSSAARVAAYLSSFDTLSEGVASNPAVMADPKSPAVTSLLSGLLQADPRVAAVGLYSDDGEKVVLIQRTDLKVEISGTLQPEVSQATALVRGKSRPWLRLQRSLPGGRGSVVLIADAEPLHGMVQSAEMGPEAQEILASREGEVLAGAKVPLDSFPPLIIERAQSGKLGSESGRYANLQGEDSIVGFAPVEGTSWFVLSRQPARVAEVATQRIQKATRQAAAAALLLTLLLSTGAYLSLIRPLRHLIEAQKGLVGDQALGGGSEIQQLGEAFKLLRERIKNSEELKDVYLGRYKINELVGSGAMGSVFRAWDPKLHRDVALKTIKVSAEEFDREKLVKSLLDEASISARFHHPNIVTTYDVADAGHSAYIAMEFVAGVSLDSYLWDRVTLTTEEAVPIGLAIARALEVAHNSDLVHHDVKPGNILLGFDASIKVTDFGISQLISSAAMAADVVCGTPGYLAPEALQGEGYGPSSDLFALGIILYEALSGKHPFFGRNLRHTVINTIVEDPTPINEIRQDLPEELVRLVDALLAKTPAGRPASASEVVSRLEALERELDIRWQPSPETFESLSGIRRQLAHSCMVNTTSTMKSLTAVLDKTPNQDASKEAANVANRPG